MKTGSVVYQVQEDRGEENRERIRRACAQLDDARSGGLLYVSFNSADGLGCVHMAGSYRRPREKAI